MEEITGIVYEVSLFKHPRQNGDTKIWYPKKTLLEIIMISIEFLLLFPNHFQKKWESKRRIYRWDNKFENN
jgi:hypothetical protein